MPIPGIEQPGLIPIDGELRLRAYDGEHGFALRWYQDAELVYLVDGVREPYTAEKLDCMYRWLDQGHSLSFSDITEIAWRFAREVEHSDNNLDMLETWMEENF